jgi:hypothetical protein
MIADKGFGDEYSYEDMSLGYHYTKQLAQRAKINPYYHTPQYLNTLQHIAVLPHARS